MTRAVPIAFADPRPFRRADARGATRTVVGGLRNSQALLAPLPRASNESTDHVGTADTSKAAEPVHRWYRIIMGFEAGLVRYLIRELGIRKGHVVLDPFCGSGTTLVECQRNGIKVLGIDANPVCILASRVKTNWKLRPSTLEILLSQIINRARGPQVLVRDEPFHYLSETGMLKRRWISRGKAKKVTAILRGIEKSCTSRLHKNFFLVALLTAVVRRIADIKFGPEVYCLKRPKRKHVIASFLKYARTMIDDLRKVRAEVAATSGARAKAILGDARQCDVIVAKDVGRVDFVLTSPPYPNEHDYTRCTRLELILAGHIRSLKELREIKRRMVRCHTKGIYVGDDEGREASRFMYVRTAVQALERRARKRSDGFSGLYGRVISEYFGGMRKHLRAVYKSLKPRARCAYVVCDQQSLLGVYIDTPAILRRIAESTGFRFVKAVHWKRTKGSTGNRALTERILIFEKRAL
jgi:DNA modification methylase